MAALARRHSEILVALSGGKDSLAVMDICAKSFPKVQAFFKWKEFLDEFGFEDNRYIDGRTLLQILRGYKALLATDNP